MAKRPVAIIAPKGDLEGQLLEGDGEIDAHYADPLADLDPPRRKVQDAPHARGNQRVSHLLGALAGDGNDTQGDLLGDDHAGQVGHRANANPAHILAGKRAVAIEHRDDLEPLPAKAVV